jgi:hypothetical protein
LAISPKEPKVLPLGEAWVAMGRHPTETTDVPDEEHRQRACPCNT